jgi:hypothetical protein
VKQKLIKLSYVLAAVVVQLAPASFAKEPESNALSVVAAESAAQCQERTIKSHKHLRSGRVKNSMNTGGYYEPWDRHTRDLR